MRPTPLVEIDPTLIANSTATVVTANERLRRALIAAFAAAQSDAPPILTIDEYLRSRHDDLQRRGDAMTLLSPLAQRLAWLRCAPALDDLDPDEIYSEIADAWQTTHAWSLADRLGEFDDNENHRLFHDWALRYNETAKARRWITEPELMATVGDAIRHRSISADPLLLIGFDVISSSMQRLIDAVRSVSKRVDVHSSQSIATADVVYWEFDDPIDELNAAIRWAGECLDRTDGTVAIVVPDAAANHDSIVGRLDALLNPAEPFATPESSRFNISGGVALAEVPVVADALRFLEWLVAPCPYGDVEHLLRSPFFLFGVASSQASAANMPESYSAVRWARGRTPSPLLEAVSAVRRVGLLRVTEAAAEMRGLLRCVGWPRPDALGSEGRQAAGAFDALLDDLGRCSEFVDPSNFATMIRLVRRTAARRMFAPMRPDSRLQVLGSLETTGLRFAQLWVTGLDDLSWPAAPRPNPFIPLRLQRAAGVPRCDANAEASFARRMTDHWLGSAEAVVFSRARVRNDESVRASRMVQAVVGDSTPPPSTASPPRGHPFLRRSSAALVDREEPAVGRVDARRLRHRGSAILRDQSACPFRAFARNRLHVEPHRTPHTFPDAAQRGVAAHDAMRALFERLGPDVDHSRLADVDRAEAVRQAVEAGVAAVGQLPAVLRESERARLGRLLGEWMRVETARPPYRIVALERTTPLLLGELEFDLQIDRIDHDGDDVLVFDYKTGDVSPNAVFGERPEEPQLPMYAIATPGSTAIAFGELRVGECRLVGWARQPRGAGQLRLRGPLEFDGDWGRLKYVWRERLTRLTDEFVGGVVDVRPRDAKACQECDLHALCRIREIDRIVAD